MNLRSLITLSALLATTVIASACAPLIVGGTAATTAIVASDRRTTGEQVEDQSIELKVQAEMRRLFDDKARVGVTAYAGWVLLTGDVPDEEGKRRAGEAAGQVEKVVRVFNELRPGPITPLGTRSRDAWITSKVKTALISTKQVPSRTMVIKTERDVVYLMGKVTTAEADRAAIMASSVSGVGRVVKLFELISPESLLDPAEANRPAADGAATPGDNDSGVETLPVN
ncbi:MAG: BON domain-containing protein [Castellaniella sp.]